MAIIGFVEINDGRDGGTSVSGGRTVRRYTRVFRATTNSPTDNAATIKSYAGAPKIGMVYPWDWAAWCQGIQVVAPHKTVWILTASYSSQREISEDPTADPPQFHWSTQQFQQVYHMDRNGKAIVNSAGDPYDPPIEGDDSRISVTMSRNLAAVPAWIFAYKDAVNSAQFTIDGLGVAAEKAKIQRIDVAPVQTRNDIPFRPFSLTMTFAHTFDARPLDQGFRFKDGAERKAITNDDGSEPIAPVPLDGNGGVLDNPNLNNCVLNTHEIYNRLDFNNLPLF